MSNMSLSLDEVALRLRANLPTIPFPRRPVSLLDILDEVTLEHVSALLECCSELRLWTKKPRIYCLLLLLGYKGHEPVYLAFQDADFDDLCIPFSVANVPLVLSSAPEACKRFLELQPIVQTRPSYMAFDESKAPAHRNTLHGDLHFTTVKHLSQGGTSTIDIVRNKHSDLRFVRKSIPRGVEESDRRSRVREFRNEIATLQKIRHHHLASCVGTYTDQTSYAMILEPIVNCNLETLLVSDERLLMRTIDLRHIAQYFGCLAMALAFLHTNKMYYNDIKPDSILIHDGRVIIFDVGISNKRASFGQTATSGPVLGSTLPYSAPEVRLGGARNESSDIWSLGRVYVEMLTVLSGRLVEDLDKFLSVGNETNDQRRRSSTRSTLDRLQEWLECINASEGYAEIKVVVSRMLSREPENRPSAASIFETIRKASPHFVCSDCANSETPDLPPPTVRFSAEVVEEDFAKAGALPSISESEASDGSPDVSVHRERSRSPRDRRASFRGFDPVRFSGSSNNSTTSRTSDCVDFSSQGDLLSRHDSAAPTVSQTWHIRDDELIDIETVLLSYSIEQGEATSRYKESGIGDGALKLLLYRTVCDRAWEVTRRMVIIDPDGETQTTRIFSNWLPLADLSICLYDDTVVLSWSDCNHDVREPTRNYVETHSKKYDARKPNNRVVLKVASSATADAGALVAALCSPLAFSGRTAKQPDRQTKLMGGERVGIFNIPETGQNDVMMVIGNLSQGTTTKLYSIPPNLELTVAMRADASTCLLQAAVSGMLITTYMSDAQHLSKTMMKKGRFGSAGQMVRKAVFTFAEEAALVGFLEALMGGWSLIFLAKLKSVKKKRTLTHDCGAADMMIWRKKGAKNTKIGSAEAVVNGDGGSGEVGDAMMTFRLHRDDASAKWISGLLPKEKIIKKIEGTEAHVILHRSSGGDVLDRRNMRAVSTKGNKPSALAAIDKAAAAVTAVDTDQIARFKAVFNNAQDLAEFQSAIAENFP